MSKKQGKSDRHVVVFGRGGWERVQPLVGSHVAQHRARPLLFRETGHAFVEKVPPRVLARLASMRHVRVRPEVGLRRPNTTVSTAPRAGVFLDTAELSWALAAIGFSPSSRDGLGIRVGLIDSGVDLSHPALIGRVSAGSPRGGLDALGHGTHGAGVIVGRSNGRTPRFGIAPSAHVRSYRVFEPNARTTESHVREHVRKAALDGCRIIVLAAGAPSNRFSDEDATLGRWLMSMGCLMVAAAGNESDRLANRVLPTIAPANAPEVYAIGAVTASVRLWNSSNGFGNDLATRVDLVAPGVDVLSTWPGGTLRHVSGSSVATAIAGGIAAALWSRNLGLGASQVIAQMVRLARRSVLGARDGIGAGLASLV